MSHASQGHQLSLPGRHLHLTVPDSAAGNVGAKRALLMSGRAATWSRSSKTGACHRSAGPGMKQTMAMSGTRQGGNMKPFAEVPRPSAMAIGQVHGRSGDGLGHHFAHGIW